MNESDQLDLLSVLSDQNGATQDSLAVLEGFLRPAIDANVNDNLLMDLLGYVDDAQAALKGLASTLEIMKHRDLAELR